MIIAGKDLKLKAKLVLGFLSLNQKKIVMGAHWKHLIEMFLMSTHNLFCSLLLRKISQS